MDVVELMGNEIFLHLMNGKIVFAARVDSRSEFAVNAQIQAAFGMDNFRIFDAETGKAVR